METDSKNDTAPAENTDSAGPRASVSTNGSEAGDFTQEMNLKGIVPGDLKVTQEDLNGTSDKAQIRGWGHKPWGSDGFAE